LQFKRELIRFIIIIIWEIIAACDGGFPYLVGKYGQDFGFLEESCLPYQPHRAECSWQCKQPTIWYTTNYNYVGGAYGKCSEVAMMKEIQTNGPVIVGFNAPQDLFWYTQGIFHEEKLDDGEVSFLELGTQSRATTRWHAFFEKTNHAVLAIGWGVDSASGKKYWLVQNTWGEDWGDSGYFRIERGVDMCAFEAMSVAFDPVIPDNLDQILAHLNRPKFSADEPPPAPPVIMEPENSVPTNPEHKSLDTPFDSDAPLLKPLPNTDVALQPALEVSGQLLMDPIFILSFFNCFC
jgi:hypothetical protein